MARRQLLQQHHQPITLMQVLSCLTGPIHQPKIATGRRKISVHGIMKLSLVELDMVEEMVTPMKADVTSTWIPPVTAWLLHCCICICSDRIRSAANARSSKGPCSCTDASLPAAKLARMHARSASGEKLPCIGTCTFKNLQNEKLWSPMAVPQTQPSLLHR